MSDLPWWAWLAAVAVGVVILYSLVEKARSGFSVQTDPQRRFDEMQRREGRRRCGRRCEHKPPLGRRCSGRAEQADHIFPWAKGGATSLGNLQYLCAKHNRQKSDKTPGFFYVWRLQRRRLHYFPEGAPVEVRWRIGQGL